MMRGPRIAVIALLTVGALGLVALFTANSLVRVRTFTADSMNYVDVARRVAAGDGLVQSTGGFNQPFWLSGSLDLPSAFTAQAPGYPLAIALVAGAGIDAADAALVVSAMAYAAILALVFLLGRRIGGPGAGAIALGAAVLFVPLTYLGRAALSECLGVAVVLLFLLLLDSFLAPRRDDRPGEAAPSSPTSARRDLVHCLGLGVLAGAAFGVRYSLWPLPMVGVAALLAAGAGGRADGPMVRRPGAAAWGRVTAFVAGALAVPSLVLGRNLLVDGRLLPRPMPSVTTLSESLERAVVAVFGGWRTTALGSWQDAALVGGVLGALFFLMVTAPAAGRQAVGADGAAPWRPGPGQGSTDRRGAASLSAAPTRLAEPTGGALLLALICLWAAVYLGAVVWRSTQANFDPIGARLALPATAALLPVVGTVVAAAVPAPRRLAAWAPVAVLAVCLGAGMVREVTLWFGGQDVRATEFRSERQQWLREHTGPGDLVIGGGTMDVPFLHPGRLAVSYAGLPYTEVLTGATLERIADRHCSGFDRLLLVVRPGVQLGGGRSDEDPSEWLGAFVADARAGRHEAWPLLEPLAELNEARVYRVLCPA